MSDASINNETVCILKMTRQRRIYVFKDRVITLQQLQKETNWKWNDC